MKDVFRQAYSLVGAEDQRPREWYEGTNVLLSRFISINFQSVDLEEQMCQYCPSLTWQQRITGCITCILIGFLLSLGSTFRLVQLLKGNPEPFAIMYTLGNIIGMCSTCFLYGPWSQVKQMFAPTRVVATGAYFLFMGITLLFAFYPGEIFLRGLWLSLSILCQFLALTWYTLSYIPYAREIVMNCLSRACCSWQQSQPTTVSAVSRLHFPYLIHYLFCSRMSLSLVYKQQHNIWALCVTKYNRVHESHLIYFKFQNKPPLPPLQKIQCPQHLDFA